MSPSDPQAGALPTGARLGPYEVVDRIGAGGMGEVYHARDTRLQRDVAVKVLPPSFASDAERLRRFEQEARADGSGVSPPLVRYTVAMAGNPVKLGHPATYEDLLAVPEHQVAEILDGELYVTPRPAFPHAFAAGMVYRDVVPFHGPGGGRRGPGGWWILFEPELHFGRAIAVPDLAGWRIERMPVFPADAFSEVVPDWACEVASPATVHVDRVRKMNLYAQVGLSYLWLVDPLARVLEVYRLEAGRWVVAGTFGAEDKVRAEPFPDLEIDLAGWWPPLTEPGSAG